MFLFPYFLLLSLLLFFKSPVLASYMSKYGWFCMKIWNYDASPAFKARFCLNRKTSPTKNIFDKKCSLN